MAIEMIAVDLDGTLLRSDKTVSAYTEDILRRCRERGIKIIYATARGNSAQALLSGLCFDGMVLYNGAKAYDDDDLLVYNRTVSPETAAPLLRALAAMGLKCTAEIAGVHYANFDVAAHWSSPRKCVLSAFDDLPEGADKLYAVVDMPPPAALIADIQALLPANLYFHLNRDGMAMFMDQDADKVLAIEALAGHWGVGLPDVAAFGDDVNDIQMLLQCGMGVAMDNALPEVKAVARAVCGACDNDGVAQWLEANVLTQQG